MTRRRRNGFEVWMQVIGKGRPIARARRERGLTQRQVAALVGKTDTTIYMLENDRLRACTEPLAYALAKVLGRNVDELFVENVRSTTPPSSDSNMTTVSRATRGAA